LIANFTLRRELNESASLFAPNINQEIQWSFPARIDLHAGAPEFCAPELSPPSCSDAPCL
jgi:hypothetical protein